jgi:tetratricopeptide (TPR) repeat protein
MPEHDESDQLAPFRQTLADLLAALRKDAGLSQEQVAKQIGYSRATVAGAETNHRQASAAFWARCDDLLATHGELRSAYAQLAAARHARGRRLALQAEADREARLTIWKASRGTPVPAVPDIGLSFDDDRLPDSSARLGRDSSLLLSSSGAGVSGAVDWPVWFGLRVAGLLGVVDGWPTALHYDDLQALLHQEILMFDAAAPEDHSAVHSPSRRQALVALAALPLTLAGWHSADRAAGAPEAFLRRCAASLTACWHLLRGSDLDAVEQMLSTYLLPLDALAQQNSPHRQAAARLASQAHRICGIVALHRNHLRQREQHCRQALHYARIGRDAGTEAAALISLASTYFYRGQPAQAAALYESVLVDEPAIPRLQYSRVHAELSVVYGQLGRERDALRCLDAGQDLYPEQPEQDPSSLYAEFTPASLTLENGLAYLALSEHHPNRGYQDRARDTLDQTNQTAPTVVPQRIRFEIANHQAAAALLLNDLDAFEAHLAYGIDGAALLRSTQRHREMVAVWQRASKAWPRQPQLTLLGERLRSVGAGIAKDSG